MSTVAADVILFIYFMRKRIGVCIFGNGRVERGVEHEYLGNAGHYCRTAFDAHDMRESMKGCKVYAELQLFKNFGGYESAFKKVRSAVDNSVTYCFDLGNARKASYFGVGESIDNELCCNGMIRNFFFFLEFGYYFFAVCIFDFFVVDNASFLTYTLADTLSHNKLGHCIEKLIFERRAAGVNNKNFH